MGRECGGEEGGHKIFVSETGRGNCVQEDVVRGIVTGSCLFSL